LKLVEGLGNIGKKHNASPGQIALAWILGQGKDFIPIPGTTRVTVGPLSHIERFVF
jgi:aryl-alcohol dehydrogenase-like predicted oxidoreductase